MQRTFIKKCFPFKVGNVNHVKPFTTGLRNSFKDVSKSQTMPNHMRKWVRQQSKDFYASGFKALVKK
jgi:hypothetical protein